MSTFGPKLSKAGSVASLICAVHCAVTPLALLALPVIAAHSWDGLDGILGAFWLSNWGENQKKKKLEFEILEEIKNDLEETKEEVIKDLRSHYRTLERTISVRDHILTKKPVTAQFRADFSGKP